MEKKINRREGENRETKAKREEGRKNGGRGKRIQGEYGSRYNIWKSHCGCLRKKLPTGYQ